MKAPSKRGALARAADLAALRAELRGSGLRATHARLAVLRELLRAGGPLSHGEVADALLASGLDRATVYRNLLDLTRAGLARRTDLGDHVWRFEATGREKGHAAHFLCNECGDVACLDDLTIERRGARLPRSVREEGVEILVKGVCDRCHA